MPAQNPPRFTTTLIHHAADPFQLLVETIRDYAIYMLDPEGRIASWNTGAERIKGYTADEVLGQSFEMMFTAENIAAEKPRRVLDAALAHGSYEEEGLRRRKDGSMLWAIHTVTALYEAGQHVGFSVVVRDITERKQHEEHEQVALRQLRNALDAGGMGTWEWNLRTGMAVWDKQLFRLLDLSPVAGPVNTQRFFDRIHPDDIELLRNRVQESIAKRGAFQAEFRIVRSDGEVRWLAGFGRLILANDGTPLEMHGVNFDVTERKVAEQRFRFLVEHSWEGVILTDETGKILYASPAAVQVAGRSEAELSGQVGFDFVHTDDSATVHRLFEQALRTPATPFMAQTRIRHRDDSYRWVEFRLTNLLGEPSLQAMVANFRDITEFRQVEDLRHQADNAMFKLLAVVEGTEDAIIGEDRNGNIIGWNPGAERLYGYKTEEVMGRNIRLLIPPECSDEMANLKERVWRGERLPPIETVRKKHDGTTTDVSVSMSPVRDGEGRVVAISKIAHDISDRKRTEKELRLRDRAVQAVSSGILITDPNQPDNPIIYANHAFEQMTGYTAAEVVGKNCRFLQGKDTDPSAVAEVRAAIRAGQQCDVELLNYRKDGTPFWNQLSISPVHDAARRLTHFIGVQTDVTERKKLETQFRQAQKMEAVGRLAGGVAHDFNNLLTIINGYSEMLILKLAANDPKREMLALIHKAGERAAALTQQLLVFSRQSVLEPKVLDINGVVADTEKMLQRLIGEDIDLTTALAPDLPPVKADPGQLQQAVINLAVNARDAMPQGGNLTVETQDVELTEEQCRAIPDCKPGRYSMLAVTDTGIGMDETTKARIFEPFFTTKEPGKGTGLGLAMVYGFVRSSGGHIGVYSEPSVGTTFKLYFPQVQERVSSGKSWPSITKMPGGTETVLIVEDDAAVRALTQQILQSGGYLVLAASNGKDAVRLAEQHEGPIHLLVTDVVMPYLGGRQVAERVTAIKPGVKVLYCSGYTDDAVVRHGVVEAGTAFMQKPYSPALLAQKARDVLDGKE